MSLLSSPRPTSMTPKLPKELLLMIAAEVGANVAAPKEPNKTMYYAEWFQTIGAVFRLRQTSSYFRVVCAPVLQSWAPWMPEISHLRRTTNPRGWVVEQLARPLLYTYVLPLPSGTISLWIPFRELAMLPEPEVGHLMLTYTMLEFFSFSSMLSVIASGLGTSHQPNGNTVVDMEAITRYVRQYDRAKAASNSNQAMERLMKSWPCDTARYITILVAQAECPGWPWILALEMSKYSDDFSSGLSLTIPNSESQSYAAKLLVDLFPNLERVNIVRYPLKDDLKEAWLERRPEFKERSDNSSGKYVYPLLSGESSKSIKFAAIPKLLNNLDKDFLNHVQEAIARRKNEIEKSKKAKKSKKSKKSKK